MLFEDVIKERYSVRSYLNKKVEKDKIDKILEAGRIAPTAKNHQPQKIYVLSSEESFNKLGKANMMRYGAPLVFMLCADMNKVWKSSLEDGYNTADMDVSIVGTHMMLEATALGLGSVWVRYFNSKELASSFELPENIVPICLIPVGYKSEDSKPNEIMHNNRNSIEDEVIFL